MRRWTTTWNRPRVRLRNAIALLNICNERNLEELARRTLARALLLRGNMKKKAMELKLSSLLHALNRSIGDQHRAIQEAFNAVLQTGRLPR